MSNEKAKATDLVAGGMVANTGASEGVKATGKYFIECYDKDGNLKWTDESKNLVVNVGLQDMNTKYFSGSSYTAAWYLGLVTGPGSGTTFSAADTLASHGATGSGGWTENTNYSGNRKAATFGTATTADPSVISNSASAAVFTMTSNAQTIAGAFLISNSTKGGSTGTLFSEASFSSPGNRSVVSGDTLNVTYTFSLS